MTSDSTISIHDTWRAYQHAHAELTRLVEELGKGITLEHVEPRIDECRQKLALLHWHAVSADALSRGEP